MTHFPAWGIIQDVEVVSNVCLDARKMISQVAGNQGLSAMGGTGGRGLDGEEGITH